MDKQVCYYKLSKAVAYLLHGKDVKFVSTNPDSSFPDGDVTLIGGGALAHCIAYSTNRKPDACTGKPSTHMLDMALALNNLRRDRTIMVGIYIYMIILKQRAFLFTNIFSLS
jgi:4-nitrophenyl phosphatase